MILRFRTWAALVAACAAAGCGSTARVARGEPALPIPAPRDSACDVVAGPAITPDSFVIALTQPVDPAHAPAPKNDAERLVFRQLYETLIRVDCLGRVLPGLAESWTRYEVRRRWTFTLRTDARFWDGAPVSARDVVAAWVSRDSALARAASGASDRTLTVTLIASADSTPLRFADPALAVAKPAPDRGWPIGTGPFWVTGQTASPQSIRATPTGDDPRRRPITFRPFSAAGARDALDERADALVTDDAAVLDYAAARPEYVSVPLTWNRTYALLAPFGLRLTRGDLDDLRRAVHVDARAAEPCDGGAGGAADGPGTVLDGFLPRRITYPRADRTARDLADRLVARSLLGQGMVAAGLAPNGFAASVARKSDGVYVVSIPGPAGRCRAGEQGLFLVPLLETRSHALVRRGLPRLATDGDGTLRLAPP